MKPLTERFRKSGLNSSFAAVVCLQSLLLPPVATGSDSPPPAGREKQPLQPLVLQLPAPTLKGTPEDLPVAPGLEPLSRKPRPLFLAPSGVTNVALGKPVTSSVKPF